jgi:NTP pyrophosphatase (non-canonical NTP hydrolase)
MTGAATAGLSTVQIIEAVKAWAQARNIINGSDAVRQFAKFISEAGELADALLKNDAAEIKDGIGDAMVVLIIIAAQSGTNVHECLSIAYNEIKDRNGILYNGTFIKDSDPRYPSAFEEVRLKSESERA